MQMLVALQIESVAWRRYVNTSDVPVVHSYRFKHIDLVGDVTVLILLYCRLTINNAALSNYRPL